MDVRGLGGALTAGAAEVAARAAAGVVVVRGRGGFGAGTVWAADGTVVTNHHVAPAEAVEVAPRGGDFVRARVVARDVENDLAVLRAERPVGSAVPVGDARRLRPGELVLAVGHPNGVRWAVSAGVVSLAPAARPEGRELIRADVALAPGNSGGPLVDARGRVVGINAMIGGGMGLAVPSHLVERLAARERSPERPRLGATVRAVALGPTGRGRVPDGVEGGALVVGLAPGGAAEAAGLIPGDAIVGIGGRPVRDLDDVERALATHAGGAVAVLVLRGGVLREIAVQLDAPARRAA
jgi:serine protease Do